MQRINWVRVIIGGLLAGVIINVVETIVSGWLLMPQWSAAMQALGKPGAFTATEIVAFNVTGFLLGIAAIYLYAIMRPRYGPGPMTAVDAGIGIWFVGSFIAALPPLAMNLFPARLVGIGLVVSAVEIVAATLAGAYLYKDATEPTPTRTRTAGA